MAPSALSLAATVAPDLLRQRAIRAVALFAGSAGLCLERGAPAPLVCAALRAARLPCAADRRGAGAPRDPRRRSAALRLSAARTSRSPGRAGAGFRGCRVGTADWERRHLAGIDSVSSATSLRKGGCLQPLDMPLFYLPQPRRARWKPAVPDGASLRHPLEPVAGRCGLKRVPRWHGRLGAPAS